MTDPTPQSPRLCPHCGLLVSADAPACQCGYVFVSAQQSGTAAARLQATTDIFSARDALAIAFQAISELKGRVSTWIGIFVLMQVLPTALIGGEPKTPRDFALLAAAMLVSSWASYGLARVALGVVRGEGVHLGRAALSPRIFFAIVVTQLIIAVPVFIGLLLFIAPGIYLMLMWSQIGFLILDGRARMADALRMSEALTRERRFEILIALAVPSVLGFMALPLEGLIPPGGSALSPGFLVFLVSRVWQAMAMTLASFVGAVVYQMLLMHRRDPPAI